MPLLILTVIVQIGLIIHVVRTGRQTYWVFVLLIAPGIGSIAYFIIELLPELRGSVRGQRAFRQVRKTINPGADLRQRELEHKMSGSVDAARRLAGELVDNGQYQQAIAHYEQALTGLYKNDPDLLLGLAAAQFENDQFEDTIRTLDRLMEHNPDFRSADGHLVYARATEACGDDEKAQEEYAAVVAYFAGAEARVRYGRFLEKRGNEKEALRQYEEIVSAAELAPHHYRKAQREWISEAKSGIKRLNS
jgi:hypothetical protein